MELCSKEGSLLSMYEMEAQLAAIKKDALDRSPDPVEVRCRQQCTVSAICVRLCVVVCLFLHMIVPPCPWCPRQTVITNARLVCYYLLHDRPKSLH